MIRINDTNYEHYKKVFGVMIDFIWKGMLKGPASPMSVIDQFKGESRAIAKKSLQVGLMDVLTSLKYVSTKDKLLLHQRLLDEGLGGLWLMLRISNNISAKVLERNKIRNLDEWYVIKEVLDDADSSLSESNRQKLNHLFSEFETGKHEET